MSVTSLDAWVQRRREGRRSDATGCIVTLVGRGRWHMRDTCGKPVVRHGLCTDHLADRIRLGGTP
jgi:hypothetical protein